MGASLARHRYAQFTVALAAFVIFAGAMVTSTGSGMAVPDWPQSFGTWTPKMDGGVFYEHGHRMVAGTLGFLIVILAAWTGLSNVDGKLKRLALAALLVVILQGLLGGLTVLFGTYYGWDHTHPVISTAHASLAQALFALLVTYAVTSAPGWSSKAPRRGVDEKIAARAAWLPILVYAQIVVGAAMRHQHAGLIIYDFPLSYGHIIPPFYSGLVALNFAHRVGGWLVFFSALALGTKLLSDAELDPWIRRPAEILILAVTTQFFLGASAVWTKLTVPLLTSTHVIGGSIVFTTSLVVALRLRRLSEVKP